MKARYFSVARTPTLRHAGGGRRRPVDGDGGGRDRLRPLGVVLAVAVLAVAPAAGQEQSPIGWIPGPQEVALGGGLAHLEVPDGFLFAAADDTRRLLEMAGNPTNGTEIGLVMPAAEGEDWFVVFEYADIGYVPDDEKDSIDADAILESYRQGTEQANERRREMGSAAIHVSGWILEPRYDEASHNLVWAMEAREEGSGHLIGNYNVRLLGREGFVSATLVDSSEALQARIPATEELLGGFGFDTGRRYADFVAGDRVAEIGLTALVAGGLGVAAGKLGLFSRFWKLLLAGWKFVLAALVAAGAAVRRLFGGGERTA